MLRYALFVENTLELHNNFVSFSARTRTTRRWTTEENQCLQEKFQCNLSEKTMPSGSIIAAAIKDCPVLGSRTIAQIRSHINNVIRGKQKKLC